MTKQAKTVQRVYLALTLLSTLAASFIWGINTLFLLDAGLSNTAAFAANAFFTLGQVLFEVPTGVVADIWGRRTSYLLGAATLLLSTLLYLAMWQARAPMWGWAIASMLLGLGFTFFSGATEAWLADALTFTGAKDALDAVLARGQTVAGVAMLTGAVGGGFIAQVTNLGVPYVIRSVLLGLTLAVAAFAMKDLGFVPDASTLGPLKRVRSLLRESFEHGLRKPAIRWLMMAAPFTMGVGIFAFYAMQPYLLQLYGNQQAFGIAGLAAAAVAGSQVVAGLIAPQVRRLFSRRTDALILSTAIGVVCLAVLGWTSHFWLAVVLLITWALSGAICMPLRQSYLNGLIPSAQRATILSFDNLMGSAGGVVTQPALGRVADLSGYPAAYLASAVVQTAALPFLALARRQRASSDSLSHGGDS